MNISAALAVTTITAAAPAAWDLDPAHSSAQFKVRHLMISHVRGTLGEVKGTVWIDEADVTRSRVEVTIDARGIETKDAKRDEHLRSADFLDVANHPNITFKSKSVKAAAGGGLQVVGDLAIRGITRSVVLEVDPLPTGVKDPWGNQKRGATARTKISRKAWGLTWNMAIEAGGVAVGDEVGIELEVELAKRK